MTTEIRAITKPTSNISTGWIMCGLGAIYYCYEYFLRISPSVMTAELMRIYTLDAAQVGGLSAFYYHSYVPMQIVVGLLMDRYGPRRLLTLACFLCAIGTYLFVSSNHVGVALAGRFIVGFGSAFAFVGAIKLATIWLPPNRFALLSGIFMCLGMVGGMIGDFLLRILIDKIGFQTTNYVAAIAGVGLGLIIWSVIRDKNPNATVYHHEFIEFKSLFINLWGILKKLQIWLNGLVGLMLYLSLSIFAELWGISYLEQAHALPKMAAAGANSMVFLGWAIGAPFWGWFSDAIGFRRRPLLIATVIALVAICILLYVPYLSIHIIYSLLFIFGFMCSSQILTFAIAHEISPLKITATAIALTNMLVMVGGNIFQPLTGKILDIFWTGTMIEGARIYPTIAYQWALSVLPICLFLGVLMLVFVRETKCTTLESHVPIIPSH